MAIEGQRMMSKTQHYRKITKPLLERKRRARMNHYLDELKDLIVETMEAQGEHVTKLEKADILEMTVQYLKTKKQLECRPDGGNINADKFRAGYTQAAYEVSKVFSTFPGIDAQFGTKLMQHLGYQLGDAKPQIGSPLQTGALSARVPLEQGAAQMPSPAPSDQSDHCPGKDEQQGGDVWRPW